MRVLLYIFFISVGFQLTIASCRAQVSGCTDPLANNYDMRATVNDGSCPYDPVSVSPYKTSRMNEAIMETSGLVLWDGYLDP